MVGFGAAAGAAVTVWVTAGAAAGAFTEPHAATLRPAVSASAGIAITLLSFIVLPSPVQKSLISLSVNIIVRSVYHYGQSRMTRRSGPNDRAKMTGRAESYVTQRDNGPDIRQPIASWAPGGPGESVGSPQLPVWQAPVIGDLAGLVAGPWAGWPVATGMGGSLTGCPAGMACARRRPGRISVISQAAGPVRDGCPAPMG